MSRSPTSHRRPGSTTPATSSSTDARATRPLHLLTLTLALALLAALIAGCGSDGGEEPAEPDEPPPRSPPNGAREPDPEQRPPVGDGRGGVELTEIGSFEAPLDVAEAPGRGDLYVVEQAGRIVRVGPGGRSSSFLDLTEEITSGGEQGLLSVAFSPAFARDGLLYVNFTDRAGDTRVLELRSPDGRRVQPESRRELLQIEQPFANHNGGLLEFGPDGLLYIGTGDGGSAADPQRNALDLSSLLGKLLRIDPRRRGDRPYRIPAANPFADAEGARPEIYSYGLRNPWRFSFDRERGWLTIGDVGQNEFEEVNLIGEGEGSGANFGWSAFEGEARFNADQEAPDHTPPVLTYELDGGNCAVTGGYVVRDPRLRSLYGRYLYADFCRGELRSFVARPGRPARGDRPLGPVIENLSSFGEDSRGRIYATSLSGPVYRLDPAK